MNKKTDEQYHVEIRKFEKHKLKNYLALLVPNTSIKVLN